MLHTATPKALVNESVKQRPAMVTESWTAVALHFEFVLVSCLFKTYATATTRRCNALNKGW